jgi:hypothetical protein
MENLPPAFAEAASRRQVAPLCQRGVIPPLGKGRTGGILKIDAVTILRTLIPMIFCLTGDII